MFSVCLFTEGGGVIPGPWFFPLGGMYPSQAWSHSGEGGRGTSVRSVAKGRYPGTGLGYLPGQATPHSVCLSFNSCGSNLELAGVTILSTNFKTVTFYFSIVCISFHCAS